MYAIQAANLTKKYEEVVALSGLDLTVETGSVTGYLGPNGSGKTTTVKLLTGLIQPTVGDSTVLGLSSSKESEKIHALSGVLTETASCYRHLSAAENLRFFGALYGLPEAQVRARSDYLLKKLDLWAARNRRAGTFSTGMKQRLSLARALVHSPQVLFLDEPTSGLDPESAAIVNRMIDDMARGGGCDGSAVHAPAALCGGHLRRVCDSGSGAAARSRHDGRADRRSRRAPDRRVPPCRGRGAGGPDAKRRVVGEKPRIRSGNAGAHRIARFRGHPGLRGACPPADTGGRLFCVCAGDGRKGGGRACRSC